ncbi:class I SAM-dependent methyltransferase [Candidatus Nitrospira bockiana]
MSEAAGLVKEYFDQQSNVYSSWYRADTPDGCAFLERKARVLECVGPNAGVLLDIGCGSGVMSRELAAQASEYIGMDVAAGMIDAARAATTDLRNVQFRVGDVTRIDVANRSIDTVCAIGLLEYLDDPDAALREMRRVLRPGGRLILSVPYPYSPWRIWEQWVYLPARRALTALVPLRTPYLLTHRFYSVGEYRRLTGRHGFQLDRVEFYNFPLLPRPFDVLAPGLTAMTVKLASPLRRTPLKFMGTGFVALSTAR